MLYVHIPKTAGVALRETVGSRFPFGRVRLGAEMSLDDPTPWDTFAFVSGHVHYGAIKRFRRRPRVIVSLRDPVDRVLSHIAYMSSERVSPDHHPQRAGETKEQFRRAQHLLRTCTIAEFFDRHFDVATHYFSNHQTRLLAPYTQPDNLQRALANLEQCEMIVLAERYEESLGLIEDELGWLLPAPVVHMNAAPARVRDIDDVTRAAIESVNTLDMRLYRRAQELFEARMAARRAPRPLEIRRYARRLADPATFSFERLEAGTAAGFYVSERVGDTIAAWTGPTPASIDVGPLPKGPLRAEIEIAHTLDRHVIDETEVIINGEAATASAMDRDGTLRLIASVTGSLPWDLPWTRVTIRTPRTLRPCDVMPGARDERRLGIAVGSMRVIAG